MATAAIIGAFDADTAQAASYAITYTPAANLLPVLFVDITATAIATPGVTCTVGGVTFHFVGRQARGSHSHYLWVGEQLTTNVAHTVTVSVAGDNGTGGNIGVIGVSGMTRKGVQAVKQSKSATGAAATVPQTVFDANALTANLILSGIAYDAALGPETVPSSFTKISSSSYATPSTTLEVMKLESGFTTTTITYGTAPAVGVWSVWSLELDVSAAPLGRSSVGLVA